MHCRLLSRPRFGARLSVVSFSILTPFLIGFLGESVGAITTGPDLVAKGIL